MGENMTVAYSVLGVYLLLVCGCGVLGAFINWRGTRNPNPQEKPVGLVREHLMAGLGLGFIAWFFSMAATLFSGYSVTGIVNEAYNTGWPATRWIPAGVGVYIGFMVLAPRCYALGKQRGYMTISELIYERYLPPSGHPMVAHALRLVSFAFLQLPVFTYLITQFRSIGIEVETFTVGGIDSLTAVLVSAAVLLICDVMGGMRAVAYSDVLQGVVLFVGSIIFLVIQYTELGGLQEAWDYWSNPVNLPKPRVANMQLLPTQTTVVSYFDFVFRTTVAATMFPHLCQRLFAARSPEVMRRGLASMNFTFFVVQLSSMITGWVAINALIGIISPGQSAFGVTLLTVAKTGTGQAVVSALLLASGICAMMSTADSALLAFSTMWVRDVLKPYVWRNASEWGQLAFGKIMALIGLCIGVALALQNIKTGTPDLTGLFSLQTVTPIHVAPAVWLGLHWRGLRGEAVLAGMITGAATTIGLVFSDQNVKLVIGDDMLPNGLSSSWVGFCVNMFVTITIGVAQQYGPGLFGRTRGNPAPAGPASLDGTPAANAAGNGSRSGSESTLDTLDNHHPQHLDIGPAKDPLLNPYAVTVIGLMLLFTVPFYWGTYNSPGYQAPVAWVGTLSAWAFTSLLISGLLAIVVAFAYIFLWHDYAPLALNALPSFHHVASGLKAADESAVMELQDKSLRRMESRLKAAQEAEAASQKL